MAAQRRYEYEKEMSKRITKSVTTENVAKLVFEAMGFTVGDWVSKERLLEARGPIIRSRRYFEDNLPRYVLGSFFEGDQGFRALMILARRIARYSKRGILRHKINKKDADGQWRTRYVYKLLG